MARNDGPALLAALFAVALAACSGSGGRDEEGRSWATGEVTIDGETYRVAGLGLRFEVGEDGYYNISGDPAVGVDEDCVPGLAGGMSLYGAIPASVRRAEDLAGQRFLVEFSGDGDDANLCFRGTNGLLGARDAWVTIDSVTDGRAAFRMSGTFEVYDDGELVATQLASARGTAEILSLE
jgi:hypothetical protein